METLKTSFGHDLVVTTNHHALVSLAELVSYVLLIKVFLFDNNEDFTQGQ